MRRQQQVWQSVSQSVRQAAKGQDLIWSSPLGGPPDQTCSSSLISLVPLILLFFFLLSLSPLSFHALSLPLTALGDAKRAFSRLALS